MDCLLVDHLNACRLCSRQLKTGQKTVEISKYIEKRYLELTEVELIKSDYLSNVICESCNSKLSEFSDFRDELIAYQEMLICLYKMIPTKNQANESLIEQSKDYYVEEVVKCFGDEKLIAINSENDLIENMKEESQETVQKVSKVSCKYCGLFFSATGLYHHVQRIHIASYKFSCDQCGKKFNLKNDLREHILRHVSPDSREKYKCPHCHSLFLSLGALRNHEHVFHSDIIEIHPCELCLKTFSSRMKYQQHHKTVHQKGSFSCTKCIRHYLTKNALNKHFAKNHSKQAACEKCGKMVAVGVYMKQHVLSHSEKQINCDCGKSFFSKSAYQNYIEISHKSTTTNYSCGLCSASFPTVRHLNRHCARQHNETKIKCDVVDCNYTASRKDYLVSHLKRHKDIDDETKDMLIVKLKDLKNISW